MSESGIRLAHAGLRALNGSPKEPFLPETRYQQSLRTSPCRRSSSRTTPPRSFTPTSRTSASRPLARRLQAAVFQRRVAEIPAQMPEVPARLLARLREATAIPA